MPPGKNTSTSKKRQVGAAERAFRERAGLTVEAAAEVLDVAVRTMHRIEKGETRIDKAKILLLASAYHCSPEETDAWLQLSREIRQTRSEYPGFVPLKTRTFKELSKDADEILIVATLLIPGLFQTEDYMRALFAESGFIDPERREELIDVRKATQDVLAADPPPTVRVIIHEAALRLAVGGPTVMRDQLRHLRAQADKRHIEIQVQPNEGGAHPGMGRDFTLIGFDDEPNSDMVAVEGVEETFYRDRPATTKPYRLVFDHKRVSALPFEASKTLIDDAAGTFGRLID
ncbi:helix-turn-helix domain-containing protein [Amycolatopsis sp. NPDC058986]|uniref:helix-turn-helix domain-containing protein n=1 Tax=unclassified Amycolatopsis TaxID=2618356 RepID=UPI00366FB021